MYVGYSTPAAAENNNKKQLFMICIHACDPSHALMCTWPLPDGAGDADLLAFSPV